MTQAEIIAMAREAGFRVGHITISNGEQTPFIAPVSATHCLPEVLRFAALVAAKEREALIASIRSAIQAGRYHFADPQKRDVSDRVLMDLLDSIQARGQA